MPKSETEMFVEENKEKDLMDQPLNLEPVKAAEVVVPEEDVEDA